MNTFVKFIIIILTFSQLRPTQADFDCEEKNKTSKCPTLECIYDEDYLVEDGYTRFCRCKVAIINHPVPENTLTSELFYKICSSHEKRLKELWINDAGLENIDNNIFGKYPNLEILKLEGNRLRLDFSEQASRIKVLDLSNNKLNSVRNDAFASLKSLTSINLSRNRLDNVNFGFENLKNLEEIYLNNNHILSIDQNKFLQLSNLKILDLSHNLLTSIDSNFCLPHLRELQLSHNKLSNINSKKVNCQNKVLDLRSLNLSNNELQFIDAETFETSDRFKILDLSSNNLTNIDPKNFQKFTNIILLNLDNNSLTEQAISCENLQNLENLNVLQLSHNQISHIYNCTFAKLKNLSKLTLLANQLEKIPPSAFSALTKLQELNLAGNNIDDIPEGLFDNLKEIKKLNISHNKLKTFNFSRLEGNTKITELDIEDNEFETLDLRQLKNVLPNLKVANFDHYLIKCEENIYEDVLEYFEDNNVVLKSCKSPRRCCGEPKGAKVPIVIGVGATVAVLATFGLFFIIYKCMGPPGGSGGIQMMPIIQNSK